MKSTRFVRVLALPLWLAGPASAQIVTNSPGVNIVSPAPAAVFVPPADISIIAKGVDSSGTITNVQVFADGALLGDAGMVVLDPPGINGVVGPVYFFEWSGAPTGVHILTEVATGVSGVAATSPPVFVTISAGMTPQARITSPANRAVFQAPTALPVTVYARAVFPAASTNLYGSITNVEIYAGATDLGPAARLASPGPPPTEYVLLLPWQFSLAWSNIPPGTCALTAVASDSQGGSIASEPANITVLAAPPSSTNLPDVVTITATDPIAVSATNAWSWLGPGAFGAIPSWTSWPPPGGVMFTNWGPKDAVFTVTRTGSTASDLEVAYSVGGTATAGADYIITPGMAIIPAGFSSALIPIIPIMVATNDATGTVALTLEPSTNGPTAYAVGQSSSATALIIGDWSRPLPYLGPGGTFILNAPAPDGAWFGVEASTDLLNWSFLGANQAFQGSIDFIDSIAPGSSARFYQIVPLSGPETR
jgi:hypothetical protein